MSKFGIVSEEFSRVFFIFHKAAFLEICSTKNAFRNTKGRTSFVTVKTVWRFLTVKNLAVVTKDAGWIMVHHPQGHARLFFLSTPQLACEECAEIGQKYSILGLS